MSKSYRSLFQKAISASLAAALVLTGCGNPLSGGKKEEPPQTVSESETEENTDTLSTSARPLLLGNAERMAAGAEAAVESYHTDPELSNISNAERFWLSDETQALLAENLFAVQDGWNYEFYETYEMNRYSQLPNYVTVDSMMHTYHLYFAYLMKHTELNYLSGALADLTGQMVTASEEQASALQDTAWKEAADRNRTFFSVAAALLDNGYEIPSDIRKEVNEEVNKIMAASGIDTCSINGADLDYTQFIPRGYYDGNEELTRYFRAMMWYGQIGFLQREDSLDRSAALMCLALNSPSGSSWDAIYEVTSFFAGASDDLTFYEYLDALKSVYGDGVSLSALEADSDAWTAFHRLTSEMRAPVINSIPMNNDVAADENVQEENKGFRFMGQRFTMDAAVFSSLLYNKVLTDSQGRSRELPDVLDVAAAFGSERAYEILDAQGDTDFENYPENMDALKKAIEAMPDMTWNSSLYANWLYTLIPLLEKKDSGYPAYMQSPAWQTKACESFAGSYTELKHDTVLYAKQVMVEMGGGDMETYDDRGYVEPEIESWNRFVYLSEKTAQGLKKFGFLSREDEDDLNLLTELASQLLVISQKELRQETLTDAEYELIRSFGGNLEHFWEVTVREDSASEYLRSRDFPAALVTDIASNASGYCLEAGTGNPSEILVIVPVDGDLRICSGAIYNFYEFTYPSSDRLTDTAWRELMGLELNAEGTYDRESAVEKPAWTEDYRTHQR